MNRYNSPPAAPTAEPFMVESRVPVGPSRFETHVQVPVTLAGIVALAVTFGLVIGSWRFGWPWDVTWIGGLVVFIAVLAWRLLWVDHISWRLERLTGIELDGTPGIGKPGPPGLLNPSESRRDVGNLETQTSDVPRVKEFVTRCFYEGTSEGAQRIKPNTTDRENYVECRDALLALGLARWRNEANHSAGWDVVLDIEKTLAKVEKHVR